MAQPDGPVSPTGIDYIDGLLWGARWVTDSSNTVTYWLSNDDYTWPPSGITSFHSALQSWASVADVNFSFQSGTGVDLRAFMLDDAQMTSLGYEPGTLGAFAPPNTTAFPKEWGLGAFNLQAQKDPRRTRREFFRLQFKRRVKQRRIRLAPASRDQKVRDNNIVTGVLRELPPQPVLDPGNALKLLQINTARQHDLTPCIGHVGRVPW